MLDYDAYSYGMISTSTLHILNSSYPQADGYSEIKETFKLIGGEAANSSIVLSKMGLKVKIDGNWLSCDDIGFGIKKILENFNINTSRLIQKKNYKGVEEIVISDIKTRTVFGTYCNLLFKKRQWNIPCKLDIKRSKIVCLDPYFKDESILVSRYCKELKKRYITLDCKVSDEISKNADVVIISGEFRNREYKNFNKIKLFKEYQNRSKGLIIFTSGKSDILYGKKNESIKKYKTNKINSIDTTGAGDSFRAGVIVGILKGWNVEKIIVFASSLAENACLTFPGVLNIPNYNAIIKYIKNNNKKYF